MLTPPPPELLAARNLAQDALRAAEKARDAVEAELAASMDEPTRKACRAALFWLHIHGYQAERDAIGGFYDVLEALAPWLAEIARRDGPRDAFRVLEPDEDEDTDEECDPVNGQLVSATCGSPPPPEAAPKWGWTDGSDSAHGPFDSREEALADARETADGEEMEVTLGTCRFAHAPSEIVSAIDVEYVLERMDEGLNFPWVDDPVFDVPDSRKAEAKAKLADILRAWAEEYVVATEVWELEEESESVRLNAPPEADDTPDAGRCSECGADVFNGEKCKLDCRRGFYVSRNAVSEATGER